MSSELKIAPELQKVLRFSWEGGVDFESRPLLQVLNEIAPLPEGTIFVGRISNGQPLLLNLKDPSSGSILILGDPDCDKTSLLLTMLTSACRLNHGGQISISIIADYPHLFQELGQTSISVEICQPYQAEARDWLWRLAHLIQQRERGRLLGPIILFVVDSLISLLGYLDDASYQYLLRIINEGTRVGVRPILTMSTSVLAGASFPSPLDRESSGAASPLNLQGQFHLMRLNQWVINEDVSPNPFGTVIFGAVADTLIAKVLAGEDYMKINSLSAGVEFCARTRGRMLPFTTISAK